MRDGQHTPLPCLQRWYPGLEAWISLDMPRYLLDSQGLSATVADMRVEQRSLEDVFLDLTGRALRQ